MAASRRGCCGRCEDRISASDKAVLCDICKLWFHKDCEGLNEELYAALNKFGHKGSQDIPWQCKICKRYASGLIVEITKMKQKQDKMEAKLLEIENKTKEAEISLAHIGDKVSNNEGRIEELEGKTNISDPQVFSMQKQVSEEVKEALDRQRRRKRVVINNLIKDEVSDAEVKANVEQLFQKFDVSPSEIVLVERLKDRRFLSVELQHGEVRSKLLKRAKELRNYPDYMNIYIRPDLTFLQRKEGKQLREEMQSRMRNGEKNLRIIGGKIIQVLAPNTPPQE